MGCAVMASGLEKTDSYELVGDKAYRYLPIEFRKGLTVQLVHCKAHGLTAVTAVSGPQGGCG